MRRVLVVSTDPVGRHMAGPGARALEMSRALARHGLDVTLAVPGETGAGLDLAGATGAGLDVAALPYGRDAAELAAAANAADGLVVGGLTLVQMPFLGRLGVPVAVDLYTPFILENLVAARLAGGPGSSRAERHSDDLNALLVQLRRGDFFACASEVQRDFWIGMLTAAGRVNPRTVQDDADLRRLIDVVPFGIPDERPAAAYRPVLRGVWPGISPTDRIVVWAGGLWDWLDPFTLIRAMALVSRRRPDARLFFMGSRTPSPHVQHMIVPESAEGLAVQLGLADRAVFFNRGWVPYAERGALLLEADVGASLHRSHVETRYAFRTRILDYIWTGLPMVVSGGDALGELVARRGLARMVPEADPEAVAEALSGLLGEDRHSPALLEAFDALRAELSWNRAVRPLAEFLTTGARAADRPEAGTGLDPTPVWRLPGRAVDAWRRGGASALRREARRYVDWRRRPR